MERMLRSTCTKMDKCHITLIMISCFVIQFCFILAFYLYVISFGTTLRRFSNASDPVTFSMNTFSVLPSKKGFMPKDIENSGNKSFRKNTTKFLLLEVDTLNANKLLICQAPTGRLGNQMFDFASALGIAHALNYKFIMRLSNPILKYFEINQTLGKCLENVEQIPIVLWRQNAWNRTNPSHNLTLRGCWRAWKYFDKISDQIRKSFTIKPKFLTVVKKFIQSHNPNNVTLIGVHVRRGDFLRQKAQSIGRVVVNKGYLLKAMNWFRRHYTDARFVVVSNDIKWCRDNIPGKDIFFSTFTEPIHDMAILSLCNHTVMSTGTFGWWGAWLAGGTVVYCSDYPRPGSYVANNTLIREDFYPPSWIGMSNGI